MRKSTRPASGTSESCLRIPDTRCYKEGWGCNGSNVNLHPRITLMGKMTPVMMIPGRTQKRY